MGHQSDSETLSLHALRLKGLAEPEGIAEYFDLDVGTVERNIANASEAGFVSRRGGRISGFQLTDLGRTRAQELLSDELSKAGAADIVEAAYTEFLTLNGELLAVCTRWQLREIDGESQRNDHTDADYDAGIIVQLGELDGRMRPVVGRLVDALDRFGPHDRRLHDARTHLEAGDHDYFTKPMFPSYHSVWFEIHEDFLATLGLSRADEAERTH